MSAISTRSAKTADIASRGLRAARRPRTAAGRCLSRDEAPLGAAAGAAGGAAAGSAGAGVSGCGGAGGAGGAAVPASASDMLGPGGGGIGSGWGSGLAAGRTGAGETGAGIDGDGMAAGLAVSHGAVSHGAGGACDDWGACGGGACCARGDGACCACGTGWPSVGGGASDTSCIDCGCWVA
jgi:hypothetical protein